LEENSFDNHFYANFLLSTKKKNKSIKKQLKIEKHSKLHLPLFQIKTLFSNKKHHKKRFDKQSHPQIFAFEVINF
jgi:hypothetical protein